MKIAIKPHPSGVIFCHVSEALTAGEVNALVQGVAKLLANGRSKITVELEDQAIRGMLTMGGLGYVEKALGREREVAHKLGGQLRIMSVPTRAPSGKKETPEAAAGSAVSVPPAAPVSPATPPPSAVPTPSVAPSPSAAAGAGAEKKIQAEHSAENQAAYQAALAEVAKLKKEITVLHREIEGLMSRVSEPSTDAELRAAVDHYRALAEAAESKAPPAATK